MNNFARRMLMDRTDRRNPYGSEGGYVVPSRRYRNYERDSRNYDYGYDYGYDYNYDNDYGYRLNRQDIHKWERSLHNADGTMGKKYDMEQIKPVAEQLGIHFKEYSPETLTMAVNMLYSDYCKVLGGDMMLYVKLAKAFLEDDDFNGSPEEKLAIYYKAIAENDQQF